MVKYAMKHFQLKSTEQLLVMALCKRIVQETVCDESGKEETVTKTLPGRIFVFSSCVVWHGTQDAGAGRHHDLAFSIPTVRMPFRECMAMLCTVSLTFPAWL